ncbi:hypothetical protein AVEN_204398-1 [Araneus ventricosus]|uniref:Uncharacterized protein n=1 Tax=Araneus ventricosus TaxID=182803 RepID=A0A4Y2QS16_ARAVE|nr:hypothetical protein AVEN_204398-1 [Araneus ventricosus]
MTEPSDSSDGKAVSHSEVSRIAVKMPPFWRENPAIWFSQLESQFITSGIVQDSTKYHTVVASVETEILSQVSDIITSPLAYEDIARSQKDDEELDLLLKQPTSLTLQKLQVPNTDVMLSCDISTQVIRPYIPKTHRYQVFRNLHDLAHPGVHATVRLICSRFVWPEMKQDIVNFTRSYIACQRSKIFRHVHSPLAEFKVPNQRFVHINIDLIGPLP